MRLVMMGTGPFAVPSLQALHASDYEVVVVVSRPPRGRKPKPSPMAEAAEQLAIPVWTPDTVNEEEACHRLQEMKADLLVVCDYGEILKPPVLETTRLGGINLHGSLLPKYRGAAPVQWAILQGEQESGSTVIQMTPGLDAGPVLGRDTTPIGPEENAEQLEHRLAGRGAKLVLEVVQQLAEGRATPQPQLREQVTKAPRLSKSDGQLNWKASAQEVHNRVRGLIPWPGAFTHWQREQGEPMRLKIDQVRVLGGEDFEIDSQPAPGTILQVSPKLVIACQSGAVEIISLQPSGKRSMAAEDFVRGNRPQVGQRFAAASDSSSW